MNNEPTIRESIRNMGVWGSALVVGAFVAMGVCACSNSAAETVSKMTPIVIEQAQNEQCDQSIVDSTPVGTSLD